MYLLRKNERIHSACWIEKFLSEEEIDTIISYSKKILSEDAKVGSDNNQENKKPFTVDYHIKNPNTGKVPRIRQSVVKWVELNSSTNWLYKKIISEIKKVNEENFDYILKFVENIQFTEYNEIQQGFYSKHTDCGDPTILENFVDIRKLSFSIQLSEENEYEGGEFILYDDKKEILLPKTKGTIIFFSSNIVHEVKPVTKGIRYSLVGWVRGPNLR